MTAGVAVRGDGCEAGTLKLGLAREVTETNGEAVLVKVDGDHAVIAKLRATLVVLSIRRCVYSE